jgi:hypothetical protein
VISDVDRRRAFSRNGIVPGFVLVDGVVQAIWRLVSTRTGATLRIEELRPLARGQRAEVEAEGRRMLAFAVPDAVHDVEFRPAA